MGNGSYFPKCSGATRGSGKFTVTVSPLSGTSIFFILSTAEPNKEMAGSPCYVTVSRQSTFILLAESVSVNLSVTIGGAGAGWGSGGVGRGGVRRGGPGGELGAV